MRCQFRTQASTAIQSQASCLSYTLAQSRRWLVKKTPTATLVMLLGLGGGLWVTTFANAQSARFANAPQYAQAQPVRLDRSLVRQPDETYEDLLRRAETAARDEAQANFDQGDEVKNVAITILAQNQGEIAPILSLQVSRDQWLTQPDAQRWATYFTNTKVLLGFDDVRATTPNQPYTDPAPATSAQPESDTSAETRSSEDFDGAASQPGTGFPTPNRNPASRDGNTTPEDGSATPSSNPVPNGGSLLTPQPPVPVSPQLSSPANSTTETPDNGFVTPQEQPSTTDTTSDDAGD